uniref:Uncharacterized protein n=1 Tax=Magnetococcus massalia (strain MO-1) TaxID=451514 RepID=A0A1S7LMB6_MAGMO|nr:Protein of unknown function [Candidatus Magnetococcus massalia]
MSIKEKKPLPEVAVALKGGETLAGYAVARWGDCILVSQDGSGQAPRPYEIALLKRKDGQPWSDLEAR